MHDISKSGMHQSSSTGAPELVVAADLLILLCGNSQKLMQIMLLLLLLELLGTDLGSPIDKEGRSATLFRWCLLWWPARRYSVSDLMITQQQQAAAAPAAGTEHLRLQQWNENDRMIVKVANQ